MTDNLKQILDSLHQQLANPKELNSDSIESLKTIASEIQSTLDNFTQTEPQPLSTDPNPNSLSHRIETFIDDFENQHPQLTQTLSMLAERLADMGI
jgi:phosphoglycerate-specific signal transduction histidine kinase